MKELLLCIVLAVPTAAMAEANDTLEIRNAQKVIVVTGDSLQSIHIKGKENDDKFEYHNTIQLVDSNYVSTVSFNSGEWNFLPFGIGSKKAKGNRDTEVRMHFGLGLCSALGAPDGMEVNTGSSWELSWIIADIYRRPWHNQHAFSVGFGLNWRNYRMTGHRRFMEDTEGNIVLTDYPAGTNPKFSRIKVFSLQVPLLYYYTAGKHVTLGIGPVVNFNTYSSIKTRYSLGGEKYKDITKGIHVNPMTVDIMAYLRLSHLQLYCKYSPCNVLDSSYGPKFQSLSFGVFY
jgi:hypothetical protein